MTKFRRRLSPADDTAQTMAEYSMLIGFIAIVVAAAVPGLGSAVLGLYDAVVASLGG